MVLFRFYKIIKPYILYLFRSLKLLQSDYLIYLVGTVGTLVIQRRNQIFEGVNLK